MAAAVWAILSLSTPSIAMAQSDATGQVDPLDSESSYPDRLGGTLSADGDLEDDAQPRTGFFRFQTTLGPWLEFKQGLREDLGLTIGGSYGIFGQHFSQSAFGDEDSVGGKLTLNLAVDVLNRGQPNALSFDMAVEDRRPLGGDVPPLRAGVLAGSITPTAATWGEFDLGIAQAYVRQNLAGGRFQYAVGKIFAPNYVNAFPFFDDNRQFMNLNFTTSPTIAVPLRGFGLVGAAYPGEGNFYVVARVRRGEDQGARRRRIGRGASRGARRGRNSPHRSGMAAAS